MNERLEDLMYLSGMTAQGCWDSMDDYQRQAVEKFAQLIVKAVFDRIADERFDVYEPVVNSVKEHFGVSD
jgi:hypothetical protein